MFYYGGPGPGKKKVTPRRARDPERKGDHRQNQGAFKETQLEPNRKEGEGRPLRTRSRAGGEKGKVAESRRRKNTPKMKKRNHHFCYLYTCRRPSTLRNQLEGRKKGGGGRSYHHYAECGSKERAGNAARSCLLDQNTPRRQRGERKVWGDGEFRSLYLPCGGKGGRHPARLPPTTKGARLTLPKRSKKEKPPPTWPRPVKRR